MAHRPLLDPEATSDMAHSNRVEFVGGPLDGRSTEVISLVESIVIDGAWYQRSVRCAEDGAMRYVWLADGHTEGSA